MSWTCWIDFAYLEDIFAFHYVLMTIVTSPFSYENFPKLEYFASVLTLSYFLKCFSNRSINLPCCEKSTLDILVMLIFGKFAECIVRIVSVGLQHHQYMVQLPGWYCAKGSTAERRVYDNNEWYLTLVCHQTYREVRGVHHIILANTIFQTWLAFLHVTIFIQAKPCILTFTRAFFPCWKFRNSNFGV